MNTIDMVIFVILIIFLIKGLFRGLIIEIFTLAGLLVGYIAALKWFSTVTAWIDSMITMPALLVTTISFLIIFIGILVVFRVAAGLLTKFAKWTMLGWVDKLGGGLFGIAKGTIIASLLALLFSLIPFQDNTKRAQEESLLFNPVKSVTPALFNLVQKTFPKTKDFYEEIKEGFSKSSREVKDKIVEKSLDKAQEKMKEYADPNK